MRKYKQYHIEIVPPSAIRKGDTILNISRKYAKAYELESLSNPKKLNKFGSKSIEVIWPNGYISEIVLDRQNFRITH